jgi:acyl-CoA reductase-like NAD-dependent aldehyde dehydrogenase
MKEIKTVLQKINKVQDQAFFRSDTEFNDVGLNIELNSNCFVNGKNYQLSSKNTHLLKTPLTGDQILTMQNANLKDVDYTVRVAKSTFDSGVWSEMTPNKRKEILLKWADLIEDNLKRLSFLETFFGGKPLKYSQNVDVLGTAKSIRWYAELLDKVYDRIAPKTSNGFELIIREPKGVIGIIIPWNYPLLIGSWKFAPAIAAGNSIVMKPDVKTSITSIEIAKLAIEAGIPPGVFNVITGDGETGDHIVKHKYVDHIAFTGSTATGKKIMKSIGESDLKGLSLECGGKSPVLILEDADLDLASDQVAFAMFYNMGQSCNAPSRVIAHKAIKEKFETLLIKKSKKFYPNNPLSIDTEVGPLISNEHFERVNNFIKIGNKEGANIISGGNRVFSETGGYYLTPTIFNNIDNKMKLAQEEIFGPVITIDYFEHIDEGVQIANDTIYGLWAAVFTNDLDKSKILAYKLKAGSVCFNKIFGGNITTPFGGVKQSGFGKDRSDEALFSYMNTKHISF